MAKNDSDTVVRDHRFIASSNQHIKAHLHSNGDTIYWPLKETAWGRTAHTLFDLLVQQGNTLAPSPSPIKDLAEGSLFTIEGISSRTW